MEFLRNLQIIFIVTFVFNSAVSENITIEDVTSSSSLTSTLMSSVVSENPTTPTPKVGYETTENVTSKDKPTSTIPNETVYEGTTYPNNQLSTIVQANVTGTNVYSTTKKALRASTISGATSSTASLLAKGPNATTSNSSKNQPLETTQLNFSLASTNTQSSTTNEVFSWSSFYKTPHLFVSIASISLVVLMGFIFYCTYRYKLKRALKKLGGDKQRVQCRRASTTKRKKSIADLVSKHINLITRTSFFKSWDSFDSDLDEDGAIESGSPKPELLVPNPESKTSTFMTDADVNIGYESWGKTPVKNVSPHKENPNHALQTKERCSTNEESSHT